MLLYPFGTTSACSNHKLDVPAVRGDTSMNDRLPKLFFDGISSRTQHFHAYGKQSHHQYCLWFQAFQPCSNTKKQKFEISLSEIGNSFAILRYLSEYKEMGCNVQFLFELMATLHEICKGSFRKKSLQLI